MAFHGYVQLVSVVSMKIDVCLKMDVRDAVGKGYAEMANLPSGIWNIDFPGKKISALFSVRRYS